MLYMMVAHHYNAKRNSVAEIMKEEGERDEYSIVVGRREVGYDSYTPCYVIGAGNESGLKLGDTEYTQDTGMGYKHKGKRFVVENVIYIKKGIVCLKQNDIGLNSDDARRSTWVFK
jgi:hypothetical protein